MTNTDSTAIVSPNERGWSMPGAISMAMHAMRISDAHQIAMASSVRSILRWTIE